MPDQRRVVLGLPRLEAPAGEAPHGLVQDLADERGCDPRTIRSHIRRLDAHGLVVDRSVGGGRRMIQRRRGRIVVLQGIDFSPMLAAAEALAIAALKAEADSTSDGSSRPASLS